MSEIARPCAFVLWFFSEPKLYLGAPASLELWWLAGKSTTLQLGVERRRRYCAGDGDPSFVGNLPLVKIGIKVTVIVFTEETW